MYPRWFYISSLASLQFSIPTVLRLLFNLNYVLFSYLFHRHSTDPSIIMNNRCHHLLDQITHQNCHELVNKCVNYWIILTPQRTCVTCPASKSISYSYSLHVVRSLINWFLNNWQSTTTTRKYQYNTVYKKKKTIYYYVKSNGQPQSGKSLENVLAIKLKAIKAQKLPTLKRGDVSRYFPSSGKANPIRLVKHIANRATTTRTTATVCHPNCVWSYDRMTIERMQHHRADCIRVLLVAPSMIDHFSHLLLIFSLSISRLISVRVHFVGLKLVSLHATPNNWAEISTSNNQYRT